MPWNNNKDPIENFFRKKAEEYDISYREEDWLKLEEQLDHREQQRTARKRRLLAAAVILLLFSLLGYAVYQNYRNIGRINDQLGNRNAPVTPRSERQPAPPPGQQNGSDREDPGDRSESQYNAARNGQIAEKKAQPSSPSGKSNNGSDSGPEGYSASQESRFDAGSIPRISSEEFACTGCGLPEPADKPENQGYTELGLRPASFVSHPPHATAREKIPDRSFATRGDKREPLAASRAFIGITAGPDLSTVGSLANFDQPGYSLGLQVEYRLSPAISIRGGLMRASVHYVADGDEYHPPSGFWSYNTVPDQTAAQCIILDIPVSLKYRFWQFGRSRLYAAAGFNSYIMLNEDYQFEYADANGSQVQRWSGKTGASHWMSNASISVGYAYDLNPRLSLQVEPFLKLPLKEVGWGNVELYSTGSLFSLNYKLY